MAKYLAGVTHKHFGSGNGGYAYLCASIIASAVNGYQMGNFDAVGWIESEQSNLWFDYLGMDKGYFSKKLKELT